MTQQDAPSETAPPEVIAESVPPQPQAPPPQTSAPSGPAPWFGYIGFGIAIVSMFIGIAGMVYAIIWFIGWTRS